MSFDEEWNIETVAALWYPYAGDLSSDAVRAMLNLLPVAHIIDDVAVGHAHNIAAPAKPVVKRGKKVPPNPLRRAITKPPPPPVPAARVCTECNNRFDSYADLRAHKEKAHP